MDGQAHTCAGRTILFKWLLALTCACGFSPAQLQAAPQVEESQPQPRAVKLDRLFGTLHLRETMQCVTFSPDNKFAVTGGGETICFWDVTTGELHHELKSKVSTVHALAYSGDGKLLAAGAFGGGLVVWDVETGAERLVQERTGAHESTIRSLAFSPDGQRLATGTAQSKAQVWDSATGEQLAELDIPARRARNSLVAWSPGGKHLAATDSQGTIHLFDAATFAKSREITALDSTSAGVSALVFLDDELLASAESLRRRNVDGEVAFHASVRIWDTKRGRLKRVIPKLEQMSVIRAMRLLPDGVHMLLHSSSDLQVVTINDGTTVEQLGDFRNRVVNPHGLAVSADGTMIARVEAGAPTLRLFDRETRGRVLADHAGHDSDVSSLAVSPDGGLLATFAHDGKMHVWNTVSSQIVASYRCKNQAYPRVGAWSPDGRYLYFGCQNQDDGVFYCFDVREKSIVFELDMPGMVMGCAISHDGQLLGVAGGVSSPSRPQPKKVDSYLAVLDARTGRMLHEIQPARFYGGMRFSADGNHLVCAPFTGGLTLDTWDLTSEELVAEKNLETRGAASFAQSATLLAVLSRDQEVEIYDTQTMEQLRVVREAQRWISRPCISADGKLLAAILRPTEIVDGRERSISGARPDLCIWNIETRELVYRLPELDLNFWQLQFAPDGKWLYGAATNGLAAGWDLLGLD